MKRRNMLAGLAAFTAGLVVAPGALLARGMRGMGMGGGMMGHGSMGHGGTVSIPEKLPAPTDESWVEGLRELLAWERHSRVQYEADVGKFGAHMPYGMIIQQEYNHIAWLTSLFAAYGLHPGDTVQPTVETRSLAEAYAVGLQLETSLAGKYETLLVESAEPTTTQVLNLALTQTRMHEHMFGRAGWMGGMGMGGMLDPDSGW
ncbi:hypothetical protein [Desulfocurvibacter africanus]|uniref:Ferritin-like domain-containing protein n=1 Tax=Desulfocurvibacter africanus subsp. africanus str. Walvis Bay TaxID=690850 RepID=F3Z2R6_DESAF|nr:hypothetical protein [Desulfocurvibacter africanus]EGJ50233.1 hypothetical protein Desaf_1904 [Desulfocurvibacter africanus subsp. africanus str. Walvis Bay]